MHRTQKLNDSSLVEEFEIAIYEAQTDELRSLVKAIESGNIDEETQKKLHAASIKYSDKHIDQDKPIDTKLLKALGDVMDSFPDKKNDLIRPSHNLYKYSLTRKVAYINRSHNNGENSDLENLHNKSQTRAFEIVSDYNSENTRTAHETDLLYWQAWLSAIGFDFNTPITQKEVLSFIVQHAEGLDEEVDQKLVNQGYKKKLGPHSLATIKRRIGSLSVFLRLKKFDNPCTTDAVRKLCEKLTKKYGASKPSGKAITKDILDDMIDTCRKGSLRDKRDKALILFGWGTGGRRRSEIVNAEMKNLSLDKDGNFIYRIPKSKTDQEGKGHPVPVKGRVAQALKDWIAAAGITDGYIFRPVTRGGTLSPSPKLAAVDVYRIVLARLKKAGYNEKEFCAHSLRSGFVTEAGRRNKNLGDVMAMTTHRNVGTVMRYYQSGNIINNSAANLADE